MVFEFQFFIRSWPKNLATSIFRSLFIGVFVVSSSWVRADESQKGDAYFKEAEHFYQSGQYFKSAKYAFAAQVENPKLKPASYALITSGLVQAGLPNAASYFFVRTLQSGNPHSIRRVLVHTQELIQSVGADYLKGYLSRYTRFSDYDSVNLSAFLYALGKDALIKGQEKKAIELFNQMNPKSPIWPFALQLRGSAHAILGMNHEAVEDFEKCAAKADSVTSYSGRNAALSRLLENEVDDLRSRCIAGEARTLYQMNQFEEADRTYDRIAKKNRIWPDILFEQAWNSFGKREFNRTLGKLVSYKSPALSFIFNPEVDVLRAQTYLALCLYSDANQAVNDFNHKYVRIGEELKRYLESNATDMLAFYQLGKEALKTPNSLQNSSQQVASHFVRGSYFKNMVLTERNVQNERASVARLDSKVGKKNSSSQDTRGFAGFLDQVLNWRMKTIAFLGGAFVRNSMVDSYRDLIDQFDKIVFIKLDMLKLAKEQLINKKTQTITIEDRERGNVEPTRRDDQYQWSFNGEFWNDELGDYVFGLESECKN
jgi:tetratricopeptide (TPR) repeat protein